MAIPVQARDEAALQRSIDETLRAAPPGEAGLWLFVYGSLAADPPFRFDARERAVLSQLAAHNALLPMDVLSLPAFSRLDARSASIAYLQSYAMIDYLDRKGGERNLARFVDELIRSRNLGRALDRTYRLSLRELESGFLGEL